MIRDRETGDLDEPRADERERAMGFRTGTTAAAGVTEEQRRYVLGQGMDLNCMVYIIGLCFAEQRRLLRGHISHPPSLICGVQAGTATSHHRGDAAIGASSRLSKVPIPYPLSAGLSKVPIPYPTEATTTSSTNNQQAETVSSSAHHQREEPSTSSTTQKPAETASSQGASIWQISEKLRRERVKEELRQEFRKMGIEKTEEEVDAYVTHSFEEVSPVEGGEGAVIEAMVTAERSETEKESTP